MRPSGGLLQLWQAAQICHNSHPEWKNKTNYSTNALQSLFPHRREGPVAPTCSGKRKFEDRMTLSEAKADDFTDTKDYVDFIQAKLKNVNIKIIK